MRSWMAAFAVGVLLAMLLPVLPDRHWSLGGLLLTPLFTGLLQRFFLRSQSSVFLHLLLPISGLLCGVCWLMFSGRLYLDRVLPAALEGADFWVEGTVASLPQTGGRAIRFRFQVEQSCLALLPPECDGQQVDHFADRLILLSHYGDERDRLTPGQRWQFRVRLDRPHGMASPGARDHELAMLQQSIHAAGYVRETAFNRLLEQGSRGIEYWRFRLHRLLSQADSLQHYSLILALVMGERGMVPAETRRLFSDTGTSHLMVISGLHVGFVASLFFALGNLGSRLWPALLLRMPARKWGALAAIGGAVSYSLLAGFSLPTQRASVMTAVAMLGLLSARQIPVSFSWLLGMLLVLLLSPASILSAGFWLSFAAVGGLLLVFSNAAGSDTDPRYRSLQLWVRPQWVVFLVLLVPLTVSMQQVSLLSPVANILAIPVVGLFAVPLCLTGTLELLLNDSWWCLWLADRLLGLLLAALEILQQTAGQSGQWQSAGQTWPVLLLASIACLLLLLPRGWPGRRVACLSLLPLLFPASPESPEPGRLWVTVLDVGQGLAVVLQTHGKVLVYDTGSAQPDGFDAGRSLLLPWLRQQGIRQIDTLIISHGDNDHAGGARSLLTAMPALEILTGTPVAGLPGSPEPCHSGQAWVWDQVSFRMLHPDGQRYGNRNDSSCVLQVMAGQHSLLLPGDISQRIEQQLLAGHGDSLRSTVLLAPHHGSSNSSSQDFISAVSPAQVVFSSGYRNQFGHPTPAVLQRYQLTAARQWQTAVSGSLSVRLGDPSDELPAMQSYRQQWPRFWHHQQPIYDKVPPRSGSEADSW